MKLTDHIYLVGSGRLGFDLSDSLDCHVYLLDGGAELALVDGGAGRDVEAILRNVRSEGFEPARIRHLLLTHGHGDHAGGAAALREALDHPCVYASSLTAEGLSTGDEVKLSLDVAKRAGIYPRDYRLRPCPVGVTVEDGSSIRVGDRTIKVLGTPGHCDGHLSYLLEGPAGDVLFGGDAVFFGGRILLQNIHDCRLDEQIRTLRRLRTLDVDVLLPGHLTLTLNGGQRHIERANLVLDQLGIPDSIH